MQQSYKKSHFPHFLRKWSESIRTSLPSNFQGLKSSLFLSTFILIAENLRKSHIFSLPFVQLLSKNTHWNNGLIILFLLFQSSKNFTLVQVRS